MILRDTKDCGILKCRPSFIQRYAGIKVRPTSNSPNHCFPIARRLFSVFRFTALIPRYFATSVKFWLYKLCDNNDREEVWDTIQPLRTDSFVLRNRERHHRDIRQLLGKQKTHPSVDRRGRRHHGHRFPNFHGASLHSRRTHWHQDGQYLRWKHVPRGVCARAGHRLRAVVLGALFTSSGAA